jgi:hypothetical protein
MLDWHSQSLPNPTPFGMRMGTERLAMLKKENKNIVKKFFIEFIKKNTKF